MVCYFFLYFTPFCLFYYLHAICCLFPFIFVKWAPLSAQLLFCRQVSATFFFCASPCVLRAPSSIWPLKHLELVGTGQNGRWNSRRSGRGRWSCHGARERTSPARFQGGRRAVPLETRGWNHAGRRPVPSGWGLETNLRDKGNKNSRKGSSGHPAARSHFSTERKRKNSLSFRSFALRRVGAAAPGGPVPPHAPRV